MASPWTPEYSRLWRLLLAGAVLVCLLCLLFSPVAPGGRNHVLIFALLAVGASLLPVRLPGHGIVMSPTVPIIFAATALFGATAGVVCAVLDALTATSRVLPHRSRNRTRKMAQVAAVRIISDGLCALLYCLFHALFFPTHGLGPGEHATLQTWGVLSLCAFASFLFGCLLNTFLSSRYLKRRWDVIWHDSIRWFLPSAILMSPIGFLTAFLYRAHPWEGIAFIVFPVWAGRAVAVYHEKTLDAYKLGVELLGRVMQEAHPYTHGHLHRVARWAKKIAEEMHLPPESMQFIEDAAILHDIGKVAVDDRVLNKVGRLTEDDWAMIRRHPVTGAELVGGMDYMETVAHWIRHHHERPDGTGYPGRLSGEEIPIESSIISVVDAFDAMVGGPAKEDQRPYRTPLSHDEAIAELRRHAGTQFHPGVVQVFIEVLTWESGTLASEEHQHAEGTDDTLWTALPTSRLALAPAGKVL